MFDGLELSDRPAELLADLGVLRGGVGSPPGHPDGLGRQQRAHQGPGVVSAEVGQQAVGTDLDGVGPHVGGRSQRVDAFDRLDLEVGGIQHHPLLAALDGHRQHEDRGLRSGGNSAHLAPDDQGFVLVSTALFGGGQTGVDRVGGDGVAGSQAGQPAGLGVVGGDQCAGDGRGHEWAGYRAVAEFGKHDREFEDPEALPTGGLRQMHTVQALVGGGLPVLRRVRDGRLQRRVQHLGGDDPLDQGSHRIGEVDVLGIDRDRHRCSSLY